MQGTLYKLTFPDGMVYVGSTKQDIGKRLSAHRTNKGNVIPCVNAMIEKHGGVNCVIWSETGEYEDIDGLRDAEYQLMHTIDRRFLLNERTNIESAIPNDYSTPLSTTELAALYGFS
jgi:hypothetical protein